VTRNPLTRLFHWLRAGYPEGIPQADYVALLGILHRDLTAAEVEDIAVALYRESAGEEDTPVHEDDIRALIKRKIHEEATDKDVARVASRLAAAGWPIMGPHDAVEAEADEEAETVGAAD